MGRIWFGTRGNMRWVKDPAVGVTASKAGWETSTQLLNGKRYVARSTAAHKEYELTWNQSKRTDLQPIMDYADGLYGDGPIYWVDPFAYGNLFNTEWAAPFQGGLDGTVLTGAAARPKIVPTPTNKYGYPSRSALYTTAGQAAPRFWIPIPPGYTLYLGAHGVAGSGGAITYAPTTNGVAGGRVTMTLLPVTGKVRSNVTVNSTDADGVEIGLGGSGTITLSALQATMVPTGAVRPAGSFVSGMGHAGCTFVTQPVLEQYSAALDKVGLSASLVEAI